MIGLVLVTHGRLADEFVYALEHIVGKQEMVAAVAIGPEDKMEVRRADIAAAVKSVDTGEGVIILTDMFGGTPSPVSTDFTAAAISARRTSILSSGPMATAATISCLPTICSRA